MICTLMTAIRISEVALVKFEMMMAQPKKIRPVLNLDLSISAVVVSQLKNGDMKNEKVYGAIAVVIVRMGRLA